MQPFFNPYSPQFQANGPNPPQQGNRNNMLQVPGLMQPQQQMGMLNNPQVPTTPNSGNLSPVTIPPGFGNASNQLGFANPVGSTAGQFGNFQPQMQMMPNYANFPQNNMGMPNGQFGMPNLNQLLALQAQIAMQIQNHGAQQAMGCPNPAFFGNPQFGQPRMNQNMQNMDPNGMNANNWNPMPMGNQQVQGHSGAVPPTQKLNVQNNGFPVSQSNTMKDAQMNIPNSNWKNSLGNNFNNNSKEEGSKWGFQKGQTHNAANGKGKFGFPNNGNRNQGRRKERAPKYDFANPSEKPMEEKRSFAVTYSEKEIQQWREERRKNFPSTANIEKKKTEAQRNSEAIIRKANARREQLKEILAKQAELGVEVAEIPHDYLSDSKAKVNGREDNRRPRDKKSRFQNKKDRKRKYNKNDRFNKKQRLEEEVNDTQNTDKRKPTLLEKLMSADIKRDKSSLRQVFRFMVMNSFFKDYPDKPLEFPLVSVKENVSNKENSTPIGNYIAGDRLHDNEDSGDDDYNDDNNPDGLRVEKRGNFVAGKGSSQVKTEGPEEEGEIID